MSEPIGNIYLGGGEFGKSMFPSLENGEHFIKVNFPSSEKSYADGSGEGMWVVVDEATFKDHESCKRGRFYHGVLANDSIYYEGLSCGMTVPFELRGESRPVVPYSFLVENYGESIW